MQRYGNFKPQAKKTLVCSTNLPQLPNFPIPTGRGIITVSERVARFSWDSRVCESHSIKTGTCLHLNQGLAQKRNFNPKSKQEKYHIKENLKVGLTTSRVDIEVPVDIITPISLGREYRLRWQLGKAWHADLFAQYYNKNLGWSKWEALNQQPPWQPTWVGQSSRTLTRSPP